MRIIGSYVSYPRPAQTEPIYVGFMIFTFSSNTLGNFYIENAHVDILRMFRP